MPKPKIPMDDDYDIDMSSPAAVELIYGNPL